MNAPSKARYERDLAAVRLLRDDLGRHPERRSDKRLFALLERVGQLAGHPEVGQLDGSRLRQQNVRRYSTPDMDDVKGSY